MGPSFIFLTLLYNLTPIRFEIKPNSEFQVSDCDDRIEGTKHATLVDTSCNVSSQPGVVISFNALLSNCLCYAIILIINILWFGWVVALCNGYTSLTSLSSRSRIPAAQPPSCKLIHAVYALWNNHLQRAFWYRVAQGYKKGNTRTSGNPKTGRDLPLYLSCILLFRKLNRISHYSVKLDLLFDHKI